MSGGKKKGLPGFGEKIAFTKKEYQKQLEANLADYNDANWILKKMTRANFHIYRIKILLGQNP